MTSILSLPLDILLQVFELATFDPDLLAHTPSWRHYDLSLPTEAPDTPWPAPSREAEVTAMRLGRVCKRWRSIAIRFELRHIRIRDGQDVQVILGELSKHSGARNSIKRITLSISFDYEVGFWDDEDTGFLVRLLKSCPNLEVFSLEGKFAPSFPDWSAGRRILRTLTSFCRKLKRLHLRGRSPFDLPVTDLAPILASASSLEALEISSGIGLGDILQAGPGTELQLASLKHLAVNPRSFHGGFGSVIAKWQLPSLTNLYFAAPQAAADEMAKLFPAFCGSLKSLSLDLFSSASFPMDLLAQASLEELGIYNVVHVANRPSTPLQSISTVVVQLVRQGKGMGGRRILDSIAWISQDRFCKLKKIIIVEYPVADPPSQLARIVSCEGAESDWKRWEEQAVEVVDRHGIQVWGMN